MGLERSRDVVRTESVGWAVTRVRTVWCSRCASWGIERTLFMLDWLLDPQLRRRVRGILNKGELRNDLARAVCLKRLGEIRDRTFGGQRHRASGLNLVTAAIILWNTVYLDRAVMALRQSGYKIDGALLPHIAPVHWNHINLTGDYSWRQNKRVEKGRFRPLRMPKA